MLLTRYLQTARVNGDARVKHAQKLLVLVPANHRLRTAATEAHHLSHTVDRKRLVLGALVDDGRWSRVNVCNGKQGQVNMSNRKQGQAINVS